MSPAPRPSLTKAVAQRVLARLGNVIPAAEAEHNVSMELCLCLARLNYEIAQADAAEERRRDGAGAAP